MVTAAAPLRRVASTYPSEFFVTLFALIFTILVGARDLRRVDSADTATRSSQRSRRACAPIRTTCRSARSSWSSRLRAGSRDHPLRVGDADHRLQGAAGAARAQVPRSRPDPRARRHQGAAGGREGLCASARAAAAGREAACWSCALCNARSIASPRRAASATRPRRRARCAIPRPTGSTRASR